MELRLHSTVYLCGMCIRTRLWTPHLPTIRLLIIITTILFICPRQIYFPNENNTSRTCTYGVSPRCSSFKLCSLQPSYSFACPCLRKCTPHWSILYSVPTLLFTIPSLFPLTVVSLYRAQYRAEMHRWDLNPQ